VLTSDELAGSLRRLRPTAMLAKDRFRSLQRRALVEPRRRIEHKKQGKKVEYVHVRALRHGWWPLLFVFLVVKGVTCESAPPAGTASATAVASFTRQPMGPCATVLCVLC
jgi:nucleolar protein 53